MGQVHDTWIILHEPNNPLECAIVTYTQGS